MQSRPTRRFEWIAAAALALLIAAGPAITIVVGSQRVQALRAETLAIEAEAAPRVAARAAVARARNDLAQLAATPTLGATLDAVAQALPAEASLAAARRDRAGVLHLDVLTPDPDRLRAALRRVPATARLREAGQARADGAIRIALVEATR